MARNGWCTHPARQHNSDAKILVRGGELACRNSWGGDLFQSRKEAQAAQSDANADLPGGSRHQGDERDDEVTSVVIPPVHATPTSDEEDRVVSDRPAPHRDTLRDIDDDDTKNDAARLDQDERARIMARGNRDALKFARERHSNRRTRVLGEPGSSADLDGGEAGPERVLTQQVRFSDRFVPPSRQAGPTVDNSPVPKTEVESRNASGISADRFDSIPEIDPSFNLPGFRNLAAAVGAETAPSTPESTQANQRSDVQVDTISSYEHVLQRARRIREAKQQGSKPIRHVRRQQQTDEHDREAVHANPYADNQSNIDEMDSPEAGVESHDSTVESLASSYDQDLEYQDDANLEWDDPEPDDEPAMEDHRGRTGGWLSHLGFRRRNRRDDRQDDALAARHQSEYDDEEDAFRDEWVSEAWNDAAGEDAWHFDDTGDDPEDLTASSSYRDTDDEVWSTNVIDRDAGRAPGSTIEYVATSNSGYELDDVLDENVESESVTYVPYSTEAYPADGQSESSDDYSDEFVSDTVTDDSRERATPGSWHRVRETTELPDLDDNLFGDTFGRAHSTSVAELEQQDEVDASSTRAVSDTPSYHAGQILASRSPRDSFFRARRFRDWDVERPAPVPLSESTRQVAPAGPSERQEDEESSLQLPDLEEDEFDARELAARGSELLDMTIDIAPEVPRACRTCRSFRSADGGARGWCTNAWAFTHRRMVNEDDLACETTIGCWWLPSDRYWLIENDEGYASLTPRMDELIAQYETPPSRRVSGD